MIVAVIMGSESDREKMHPCFESLETEGIKFFTKVLSAHRTPDETVRWAKQAKDAGVDVIIAAAGLSAALPGVLAAHTDLPVIGVPINAGTLGGLDALLSISQMPPGVPVATVGINGAKNAALLAIRILRLAYGEVE